MAVSVTVEFKGTTDQYDQVNEKMDIKGNPPDGLIVHSAADLGGTMRVIDIWDSREAYEKFGQERLGPTVIEVVGPDAPQVAPEITEPHSVLKP